jgi:hypothetical protein
MPGDGGIKGPLLFFDQQLNLSAKQRSCSAIRHGEDRQRRTARGKMVRWIPPARARPEAISSETGRVRQPRVQRTTLESKPHCPPSICELAVISEAGPFRILCRNLKRAHRDLSPEAPCMHCLRAIDSRQPPLDRERGLGSCTDRRSLTDVPVADEESGQIIPAGYHVEHVANL